MVAGPDELKDQATSFLSRELRSLHDVKVTADDYDWTLHVILMFTGTEAAKRGIVMAVTITDRAPKVTLRKAIAEKTWQEIFRLDEHYRTTILYKDSLDKLKSICEEAIADFDSKYLKLRRDNNYVYEH